MGLASGSRLGVYEVVALLGAGGMGEVYRARDTKLGREVAVKVLPEALASDTDRIARFEREAKALAALNHPHIAALHGLEESSGRHFLIMELVEGETLAERLQRGPMPVAIALGIAHQIAEALEAAHERGIVHRDLKPANVKITPDEKVKVLDFGLAKVAAADPGDSEGSPRLTHSPTLSLMATQAGMILGTAAYMSPEQAKGLPADHRSDVFSFGCVFYEMLTGRQPFQGETAPDILASVLVREPDLGVVPPNLNPRIVELLRRCFEKNPRRRWQAVGDLRAEIEAITSTPIMAAAAAPILAAQAPLWRRAIPVAVAVVVTAAATAATAWYLRPAVTRPVVRFAIAPTGGEGFTNPTRQMVAISSDGSMVAYIVANRIYVRGMDEMTARPITGTESSNLLSGVVFSPDGKSVAYWSGGLLRRIGLSGGASLTICTTANPTAVSWNGDSILFSVSAGVMRVSAGGGQPELVIAAQKREVLHAPQWLSGDTILLTVADNTQNQGALGMWDGAKIVAQSLKSGDRTIIHDGGGHAQYVRSGHLVYAVNGVLFAVPFDAAKLRVTGEAVPVVEGVRRSANASGVAQYAVSANGSLVYIPGPRASGAGNQTIVLDDGNGTVAPLKVPAGSYTSVRMSPDGKWLAYDVTDGNGSDVWIHDLSATTSPRRVTFGGKSQYPVWSPDGKRVVFESEEEGVAGLSVVSADGTGTPERLTRAAAETAHVPESWSSDPQHILYDVVKAGSHALWVLSVPDKKVEAFGGVASSDPTAASFSPDGRWVAYTMSETRHVVYAQPFPATGAKYQISRNDDGHHPVWTADGRELFYLPGPAPQLAKVKITTSPSFSVGVAQQLRRAFTQNTGPTQQRTYDVTSEGRLIGIAVAGTGDDPLAERVDVVLNWSEELKSRVPSK